MRTSLFNSAAVLLALALLHPGAALAAAPEAAAQPAPAGAQAPADNSNVLGEVVVTAERFSESAQKTPLVITTLNGSKLQGVTSLTQLQTVTPGIALTTGGNVVQTFIRGVGSLNATSAQESAVAYNVDGVFLFTSTQVSPEMYDLDRVEILKGPQGTLYGRNASGGAVNLITHGASLSGFTGFVEGEVGNFNEARAVAAVNLPLSSTLAVRVAGEHAHHDGYLTDGTDDQNVTAGRVRLLWEPTSTVTLHAGLDGSANHQVGPGSSLNPNRTNVKWIGALDPRAQTGIAIPSRFPPGATACGPHTFNPTGTGLLACAPNTAPFFHDTQWSAFGQLDVDLGLATLTVLPAYRHEGINSVNYTPGYPYAEQFQTDQTSIETRLSHQDRRLRWVAGAYYFKVDQKADQVIRSEPQFLGETVHNPGSVQSYAVFGEATYSVLDTFRLIGGLRYSDERSISNGFVNAYIGPPIPGLAPQTPAFNPFNPFTNPTGEPLDGYIRGRSHASAVTWKGGAQWDVTPTSMAFFTASRGFKGGGSYVDLAAPDSSFRPEFLTAYELGSRNRFLDNTLQVNVELFYWKLEDQQVTFVGLDPVNQFTLVTVNAGKGHMYGADVDVTWKATPDDTLRVGFEYLKARYDAFVRTGLTTAITGSCATTPGVVPGSELIDCSGHQMLRAPEWSGSGSYQHRFRLDQGDVTFDVDTIFASARYLDIRYTPLVLQKSSAEVGVSLSFKPRASPLEVTGWVRNIGDARIMDGGAQTVAAYHRPVLMPPRTFGVTAHYAF